ncbi:MAG: hypothetical protein VYB60_06320, partial [SAR324 cluster bacterium]|nr:hypothetical protein [SAR324 cluster bacterium]
ANLDDPLMNWESRIQSFFSEKINVPFCRSDNPVGRVRRFMRRNPIGQKHLKNKLPDYAVLNPTIPTSFKI